MDIPFVASTLARRGLLKPGRPDQVARQLAALRRYGFSLAGELRSAAARHPDRFAVIDETGRYTYRVLLQRTQRLASALRAVHGLGAPPVDRQLPVDGRLGVLCRNHVGMVQAMVAASMLGVDVVLMNTGLSGSQLVASAAEQRLRAIVFDDEFAPLIAELPRAVSRIGEAHAADLIAHAGPQNLGPPVREGRTIVLTSGTTGTPRGARRPAPNGLRSLATMISRIPLRAGDRMLIAAPIFHTWGYAAAQLCLAMSGTMVLSRRFDPAHTLDLLVEQRCRAMFAVQVMLRRMLEVPARPTSLAVVAVSGSALPGGLPIAFMDAYGDVLYNLYGSTEVSWASIATPAEIRGHPGTAGRPPRGTRVAILGPDGVELPAGQTGRIFVGNDMLFEGYTNGTSHEVHSGLLSTGDVGHRDADGLLYVDGRADDMIISGGENVFPSAVEDLLAGLPQVREVTVLGVPDPEFGQRLAVWLALRPGEQLDAEAVREYVRLRLARFCVPRDVRFIDELPRNATGKVVPRLLPW